LKFLLYASAFCFRSAKRDLKERNAKERERERERERKRGGPCTKPAGYVAGGLALGSGMAKGREGKQR
jgi:hypothetical protein